MLKIAFVDKDDTIVKNNPYDGISGTAGCDPTKIEFLPDAIKGLQLLQKLGYTIVIITNQSGIARGYFTEREFLQYWNILESLLWNNKIYAELEYCPHHVDGINEFAIDCDCRKPKPGMLLRYNWDRAVLLGDYLTDWKAAIAAGIPYYIINKNQSILDIAHDIEEEECREKPLTFRKIIHRIRNRKENE